MANTRKKKLDFKNKIGVWNSNFDWRFWLDFFPINVIFECEIRFLAKFYIKLIYLKLYIWNYILCNFQNRTVDTIPVRRTSSMGFFSCRLYSGMEFLDFIPVDALVVDSLPTSRLKNVEKTKSFVIWWCKLRKSQWY